MPIGVRSDALGGNLAGFLANSSFVALITFADEEVFKIRDSFEENFRIIGRLSGVSD